MKTTLKNQVDSIKHSIRDTYNEATEFIKSLIESNSRRSETPLQAYRRTYTSFNELLDRDKKISGTTTVKPEFVKGVNVPEVRLKPLATQSLTPNYAINPVSEFIGQRHPQQAERY